MTYYRIYTHHVKDLPNCWGVRGLYTVEKKAQNVADKLKTYGLYDKVEVRPLEVKKSS